MSNSKCGRTAVASLFAAALLLPLSSIAQEDEAEGPSYIQVRVVHTTAAGSGDWVELQKQAAEAQDEDAPWRDVWQVVRGELDTFHIVSGLENFAALDGQGEGGGPDPEWVAAITPTVHSRSQTIMRMHDALNIPNPDDYEPSLLTLRYFTLREGQGEAFHTWLREELQPAIAAGGTTGVYFGHVTHGGNVATCVIAGHFANWAELDGPGAFAHMSEEERDALFADWGSMVANHEVRTLRYRADLSY
ncbi:MAG: hypothetical protein ACR2QT_03440 [Woeseiaceae bacterium]